MLDQSIRAAVARSAILWMLAPAAAAVPHYTVATDERLRQLDVSACFDGSLPRQLTARHEGAAELLRSARLDKGDDLVELQPQGSTLPLPRTGVPACVNYRVDLSDIGKRQWRSGDWRARTE